MIFGFRKILMFAILLCVVVTASTTGMFIFNADPTAAGPSGSALKMELNNFIFTSVTSPPSLPVTAVVSSDYTETYTNMKV
jgi:hypothetical protein